MWQTCPSQRRLTPPHLLCGRDNSCSETVTPSHGFPVHQCLQQHKANRSNFLVSLAINYKITGSILVFHLIAKFANGNNNFFFFISWFEIWKLIYFPFLYGNKMNHCNSIWQNAVVPENHYCFGPEYYGTSNFLKNSLTLFNINHLFFHFDFWKTLQI